MKKSVLLMGIAVLAVSAVQANTISESQQKYVEKYKKQKCIPQPEDQLINTDKEPALTDGFESLFNGKDLNGWTARGGRCNYEVKDEVIVGTCVPGSPSTYLCTDKADFKNFIFTCEIKWEVDGNTGILIRSKKKPTKKAYEHVFGPQVEMEGFGGGYKGRGWSGGIYGQGYSAWLYPLWLDAHKDVRESLKADDWNRLTIKAEGDTIKTWLNGIPAAHWKCTPDYMEGLFALQVHSGGKGTILFRDLKVKEL